MNTSDIVKEPLKNAGEVVSSRQKSAERRSLYVINEHFEPIFNGEMTTQVVVQRFIKVDQSAVSFFIPVTTAEIFFWLTSNRCRK
ncbi:hypothetical protein [Nitrosomonas sp.]|uniref:hypothetical protein n=1 Tax=Nitrosomonas sp. TaxID=42353 RepID=UPI0025F01B3F|nr:hypothetical protein [Nitrosomonas sp.]